MPGKNTPLGEHGRLATDDHHRQVAVLVAALRSERRSRGLSLSDMAALVDTSSASISRWESGLLCPGVVSLVRWSAVLGYGLELFDACDTPITANCPPFSGEDLDGYRVRYLAAQLATVRRLRELTQTDIALLLGISVHTLANREAGAPRLSVCRLIRHADALEECRLGLTDAALVRGTTPW
jgi:transcriptional regulator with XRE-family HTH domain